MSMAILFGLMACALAIYFGAETIADAILESKRDAIRARGDA